MPTWSPTTQQAPRDPVGPDTQSARRTTAGKVGIAAACITIAIGAVFGQLFVLPALLFGGIGYGLSHLIQIEAAHMESSKHLLEKWCAQNGWRQLGDFKPRNLPFTAKGGISNCDDAIAGVFDGMPTIVFTFRFAPIANNSKQPTAELRVMQITGPRLPTSGLMLARTGIDYSLGKISGLTNVLDGQRRISLESVNFNKGYELKVERTTDETWVRRVFDPITIDAILSGAIPVKWLTYYAGSFWFTRVITDFRDGPELIEQWRQEALLVIARLSRVQD